MLHNSQFAAIQQVLRICRLILLARAEKQPLAKRGSVMQLAEKNDGRGLDDLKTSMAWNQCHAFSKRRACICMCLGTKHSFTNLCFIDACGLRT